MRDLPLCMEILSFSNTDLKFFVDLLHSKGVMAYHRFEALIQAFKQLAEFDQLQGKDMSQHPYVYSTTTIIEFHHFLLGAYFAFDLALKYLQNPNPDMPGGFKMCYQHTATLWRICHSSILREHLALLNGAGLLDGCSITSAQVAVMAGSSRGTDPTVENKSDSTAETSNPHPEGDADDDGMHESTNVEIHALEGDPTNEPEPLDLGLLVLRWFRLHVSHFAALDGLLSFFHGQPLAGKTVRICLLAVRSLQQHEAEWEPVLERVLKDDFALSDRIPEAINIICAEVAQHNTEGSSLRPSIFRHFYDKDSKHFMCCNNAVHCEMALAYLIKNFGAAKSKADLTWFHVCLSLCFFCL